MIDVALSATEAAAVIRAMRVYIPVCNDVAYQRAAQDLLYILAERWQQARPNDEELRCALEDTP